VIEATNTNTAATAGNAVKATRNAAVGTVPAIFGESKSTADGANGIIGKVTSTASSGYSSAGVWGRTRTPAIRASASSARRTAAAGESPARRPRVGASSASARSASTARVELRTA
jgi:hypothetical protein